MKKNLELFILFIKIGLFTFGGGYAMISQIREYVVEKKKWMTEDELIKMIAISESTPGPLAINMATYVGYKQNKVIGSIFSTIGVILPSFIIIYILSFFINDFLEIETVKKAFYGINVAVAFLIIRASISMIKQLEKNIFSISLFTICSIVLVLCEILTIQYSSIFFILIGGLLGIIFYSLLKTRSNKI